LSRNIFIARELTKIHETFYRDSVDSIKLFKLPLKGELTVVISKKHNNNKKVADDSQIKKQAMKYLKKYSLKDVVELISTKEKLAKNKIYKICLKIKNEKNY
jgi:16S rRNA C1402 (ribose-2'-O) methylase RsmI